MTEKKKKEFQEIADVMHHMQKNLKAPKSQYNSFGKYNYRNLEDIKEGIKKVMPEGCYIKEVDEIKDFHGYLFIESTVSLSYYDMVVETKAYAGLDMDKKGMDFAQKTGAASSYARKYAYNALFGIDDTKDADSMDNSKIDTSPVKKTGNRTIDKWVANACMDIQAQTNLDDLKLIFTDFYKTAKEKGVTEEQLGLLEDAKDMRKAALEKGVQ